MSRAALRGLAFAAYGLIAPPAFAQAAEAGAPPPESASDDDYERHRFSVAITVLPVDSHGALGGEGTFDPEQRVGLGLSGRYGARVLRYFELGAGAEAFHFFGHQATEQVRLPVHLAAVIPLSQRSELDIALEGALFYLWIHNEVPDMNGDPLRAVGGMPGLRVSGYRDIGDGSDMFFDVRGSFLIGRALNGRGYVGDSSVIGLGGGFGVGIRTRL